MSNRATLLCPVAFLWMGMAPARDAYEPDDAHTSGAHAQGFYGLRQSMDP